MVDSAVSWRIDGPRAHLTCGPLEAIASCDSEGHDLIVTKWNCKPVADVAVLGSSGPNESAGSIEIAERYVRGSDFVASASQTGRNRIATQVYWRAGFDHQHSTSSVELVLSAQTDLLDSVPTWTVTSFLRGAARFYASSLDRPQFEDISSEARSYDLSASTEHLFVFRIVPLGMSYAQMVHPSDFVAANAPYFGNQPFSVEATLFPEHLEKGVIRRGRIRAWFLPIANDLET